MMNIIKSRFPNFESRKKSGLPLQSQIKELDAILESNQTLLVVHNDKIKRKIRSSISDGYGKLLPPTFTFRSLFNHLSGFTCKSKPVIPMVEQTFRMRKAIIQAGAGNNSIPANLIKNCCKARYDWGTEQDCPPSSTFVGNILGYYVKNLSEDGVWDEINIIEHVINELSEPNPNPLKNQLNKTFKTLFINGVCSVSKVEAKLLEKFALMMDVNLWVYEPYCFDGKLLKDVENQFSNLTKPNVHLDVITPSREPNISLVEVAASRNTPSTVAGLIKRQLIDDKKLQPSDITVVASTQDYAISLEEALDRFGIANSQQARTHDLCDSSVIRLFKWFLGLNADDLDATELFSILKSSRIEKMLANGFRLHELENVSLPQLKPKSHVEWLEFWKNVAIPSQLSRRREKKASDAELATLGKELLELVDSIGKLFEIFSQVFRDDKGSNFGITLAHKLVKILNELSFDKWLSPALALHETISLVFDKEWESEQLAWQNLKDLVDELSLTPDSIFPMLDDGTPDFKNGLNLLIDMAGYKTRAIDKAGVQIISPRNFMGNSTSQVYLLGMNHGEYPGDLSGQVALDFLPRAKAERMGHEAAAIFEQHILHTSSRFIAVRSQKKRDEMQLPNSLWGRYIKKSPAGTNVISENIDGNFLETQGLYVGARIMATGISDKLLQDFVARELNIVKRDPFPVGKLFHGLLGQRFKPETPFAVTKLEKHFECPFVYFGKITLGIRDETRNFQHMQFGSMIHSVLETNHVDWKSNPESRRLYDPVKLREILNKIKETYRNILEPYFMHKADLVISAFCNEPDFLRLQDEGYVQTESEMPFIYKLGLDDAGKEILISVKMDAIHEKTHDDVCQSLIEDYKTGRYKADLPKMAFQGMLIQLPLYAYLYEANKAESHPGQIKIDFRYVYLGEQEKDREKIKPRILDKNATMKLIDRSETPAFKLMGDDLAKKVLAEVGTIRKGLISLTPYHPNYVSPDKNIGFSSPCLSYCSMRTACRTSEGVVKSFG